MVVTKVKQRWDILKLIALDSKYARQVYIWSKIRWSSQSLWVVGSNICGSSSKSSADFVSSYCEELTALRYSIASFTKSRRMCRLYVSDFNWINCYKVSVFVHLILWLVFLFKPHSFNWLVLYSWPSLSQYWRITRDITQHLKTT